MGRQLGKLTEVVRRPHARRQLRAGGSQGQLELDQSWERQVSAGIKLQVEVS